jgi:chromosomal replication initiation ATPase DnaA
MSDGSNHIRKASDTLAALCVAEEIAIRQERADSPKAQVKRVIEAVCAKHEVPYHEVMGRKRFAEIVAARHEAIVAVAEAFPWMSLPKLGRIFGRDHTSILHAMDKHGVPRRSHSKEGHQVSMRADGLALGRMFRQLSEVMRAE